MENICLIPARGGSKRLPRKNIKMFHGKPIIAWSIETAKSSGLFSEIFVSTDDREIAEISKKYGAKIPFFRPEKLSDDFSTDRDVRDHFINWLNKENINVDYLCYLYPTAPFITIKTLSGCYELLIKKNATSCQTITTFAYPILRAQKKDKDNFLKFNWQENAHSRSQDLPEFFHDAGQCYFFDLKKYNEEEKIVGYQIPRLYSQDIDTLEDFSVAEKLFQIINF